MSRHSKNNTASAVFTYAERQRIGHWGTQKTKLGEDSQRRFEQCFICLHKAEKPACCPDGHIFCRECAIENLVNQRKEKERDLEAWTAQEELKVRDKAEEIKRNEEKRKSDFVKAQKDVSTAILKADYTAPIDDQDDVAKTHKFMKEYHAAKKVVSNTTTKELLQESFWVPDTTPNADASKVNKPDVKVLLCPSVVGLKVTGTNSKLHTLKLKDLVNLKLEEDDGSEGFACYVCKKKLKHQKVGALRKCGHVMCHDCIVKYCITQKSCYVCEKPCKEKHIIKLKSGGSGFSSHNQVETSHKSAAFRC
mmetsp:Transcript_13305/g.14701  ORF Transcript_13305/g.14701 Transcript_13305/m.14701 type:complete len:307 (+) Transcript_13305:26-946(+)